MEKDRKARVIAVVAVFVALIGVSVGFAAFAQTLTISGTADVKASKWDIRFKNLQPVALTGRAEEVTQPTINTNDTSISEYSIKLEAPGDTAEYTFDVANDGSYDAKISSLNVPMPTCTGKGEKAADDQTNVCKNVTYTLTYEDGNPVAEEDTLKIGETKTMKLTLTYSADTTSAELPNNDVALSNLAVSIIYSQD